MTKSIYKNTNKIFKPLSEQDLRHPTTIFIVKDYNYEEILQYLYEILKPGES